MTTRSASTLVTAVPLFAVPCLGQGPAPRPEHLELGFHLIKKMRLGARLGTPKVNRTCAKQNDPIQDRPWGISLSAV